jgi:hypothetical protein
MMKLRAHIVLLPMENVRLGMLDGRSTLIIGVLPREFEMPTLRDE